MVCHYFIYIRYYKIHDCDRYSNVHILKFSHLKNNRSIEPNLHLTFFFFFDNLFHSDVHHNAKEKICHYTSVYRDFSNSKDKTEKQFATFKTHHGDKMFYIYPLIKIYLTNSKTHLKRGSIFCGDNSYWCKYQLRSFIALKEFYTPANRTQKRCN